MKYTIIAIITTFIAGFFGTIYLDGWFNWPGGGTLVAICVMGAFILNKPKKKEIEETEYKVAYPDS